MNQPSHLSRGFTLIELMVVMVIVGVIAGTVSLGLEVLNQRDGERQIARLRLVLEASADRANLRGQPVVMELLEDGYRFAEYDVDGKWHALEKPPLFVEKRLPEGYRWAGLNQQGGHSSDRLLFGSTPPPFELMLRTPAGIVTYVGRETGQVSIVAASQGAS